MELNSALSAAGLSRTGTASLSKPLEIILGGPVTSKGRFSPGYCAWTKWCLWRFGTGSAHKDGCPRSLCNGDHPTVDAHACTAALGMTHDFQTPCKRHVGGLLVVGCLALAAPLP